MTFLGMTGDRRSGIAAAAGLAIAGVALSGCMSSPTYGTDKTSSEQLIGDVSNILALAPKRTRRDRLQTPAGTGQTASRDRPPPCRTPQDSVASAGNPQWPESPEQRRARLRAEADENRDDPGWRPNIDPDRRARPRRLPRRTGDEHPPSGDRRRAGRHRQVRLPEARRSASSWPKTGRAARRTASSSASRRSTIAAPPRRRLSTTSVRTSSRRSAA